MMRRVLTMKRAKAITDAEWRVTFQLEIAGKAVGSPRELHYADSYLAERPHDVGTLIVKAITQEAERLAPQAARKRR